MGNGKINDCVCGGYGDAEEKEVGSRIKKMAAEVATAVVEQEKKIMIIIRLWGINIVNYVRSFGHGYVPFTNVLQAFCQTFTKLNHQNSPMLILLATPTVYVQKRGSSVGNNFTTPSLFYIL